MKIISVFVLFVTFYVSVLSTCAGPKLIKVREHVWVGDDVSESYKTSVYVASGSKLYDVMGEAAKKDSDFNFESIYYNGLGHFITEIGGNVQDPASNKYWLIFITDNPPKKNNPPGQAQLSPLGVSSLVVENNKHYLFWLRTANFTHT